MAKGLMKPECLGYIGASPWIGEFRVRGGVYQLEWLGYIGTREAERRAAQERASD